MSAQSVSSLAPEVWAATAFSDSQMLLSLIVASVVVALGVWSYRKAAAQDEADSLVALNQRAIENAELLRQIDSGEYRIPLARVPHVMHAIYPESPRWKKAKEIAS